MKICGALILFNPDRTVLNNINSYINQIDVLYVIDNSATDCSYYFEKHEHKNKISYFPNSNNLGIAKSLNIAAHKAIENGYQFMLTMDQDTFLPENYVSNLYSYMNNFDKTGILSAFHNTASKAIKLNRCVAVLTTMMSGNILNLNSFKCVGEFEEKLFIDYVDTEYCLRLNANNFKVIRVNDIKIFHPLGAIKKKELLFFNVYPTNHSPVRYYYRTRNRLYCMKKYAFKFPTFVLIDIFSFFKELIKIIFFEKKRLNKIQMIIAGVFDFYNNKYEKTINS